MFISALILLIFCADIRDEARDRDFTGAGGFIIILAEKPRFKGKLKLKFYSAQRMPRIRNMDGSKLRIRDSVLKWRRYRRKRHQYNQ
jgi:hypothetical protein